MHIEVSCLSVKQQNFRDGKDLTLALPTFHYFFTNSAVIHSLRQH